MNALLLSFVAASFASCANLTFRKSVIHSVHSSNYYLIFYYLLSLLSCFVLYPTLWEGNFNLVAFSIGASVGLLNGVMMLCTSKALKEGPAGLTFAFQNASAVFPGMVLFILFGLEFGYSFSFQQGIGVLL